MLENKYVWARMELTVTLDTSGYHFKYIMVVLKSKDIWLNLDK